MFRPISLKFDKNSYLCKHMPSKVEGGGAPVLKKVKNQLLLLPDNKKVERLKSVSKINKH